MHIGASTFFEGLMKDRSNSLRFRVGNSLGQAYTGTRVSTVDLHLGHKADGSLPCLHKLWYVGIQSCVIFTIEARRESRERKG